MPIKAEEKDSYSLKQQSVPDSEFHRATLYGKIAEKYDYRQEHTQALEYYQKALEFAPDLTTSLFYQTKIKRILNNLSLS